MKYFFSFGGNNNIITFCGGIYMWYILSFGAGALFGLTVMACFASAGNASRIEETYYTNK